MMDTVSIVDGETKVGKLDAVLRAAGFWEALGGKSCGRDMAAFRVVIHPELAGFQQQSPLATDPALVETLVEHLCERGYLDVSVVGSSDSSALWASNRDIYAVCDLLGYRFKTPKGFDYKVVDLSEDIDSSLFPSDSLLHSTGLSRAWTEADFRIVISKSRTDEETGYALCLDSLIGILPEIDKDLHYRRRRDAGEVVANLLSVSPPDFCLIDAVVSTHGAGGKRAPEALATDTLIASPHAALSDFFGALKMGLDPYVSPIFNSVVRHHPLPRRYRIDGSIAPYVGWKNVPPLQFRTVRYRTAATALDRLVQPWLQKLDPELFPFKNPLDARLNSILAPVFRTSAATGSGEAGTISPWLMAMANLLLGALGHAAEIYRILYDKDALRQRAVSLGIDPAAYRREDFEAIVDELEQLEPIAAQGREAAEGLRWRMIDAAVVFTYTRDVPINFDMFTRRVDIAKTIQFMNDYIGGVVVPVMRDDNGRPLLQAERNLYLPQPNYLALFHGKHIDVTKLEVVRYEADRHQLFWKTIGSENDSAVFDDGIASFERTEDGTRITITGRQLFTLPLFWQVFDLDFVPELKALLVTDAYRTFFDRTVANLEALVEGRNIRIGRAVDESAAAEGEKLVEMLGQATELLAPIIKVLMDTAKAQSRAGNHGEMDESGFMHFRPQVRHTTGPSTVLPPDWVNQIRGFLEGLSEAARRDFSQQIARS